ncbi:MAG: DNA-binding transcriptional MerR regulator [Saprospiraceae bacterium]|jgi:DNA-binding transcriptional MerR regulator
MSQVETLTGINAHTLRVWERRYDFLLPLRTQTNIRLYTDDQLKNLLNIGILVRNGHRISAIDKMPQTKIHNLVTEILTTNSEENQDRINGLVLSMIELDEEVFEKLFNIAVKETGLISTFLNLIYPFLNLVGGLWITNKAIPAQEHFISNLIRQKIISAIDALPNPGIGAKRILLFLLEGESHELGLLLAYYIAKSLGWKVYYFGQNVPLHNMDEIIRIAAPHVMMTMFIAPRPQKTNTIISDILKGKNIPLLISGNPLNFKNEIAIKNAIYLKSPMDFETHLSGN